MEEKLYTKTQICELITIAAENGARRACEMLGANPLISENKAREEYGEVFTYFVQTGKLKPVMKGRGEHARRLYHTRDIDTLIEIERLDASINN